MGLLKVTIKYIMDENDGGCKMLAKLGIFLIITGCVKLIIAAIGYAKTKA